MHDGHQSAARLYRRDAKPSRSIFKRINNGTLFTKDRITVKIDGDGRVHKNFPSTTDFKNLLHILAVYVE